MARRTDPGKLISRDQLTPAERAYVEKLETMGLEPDGFRRFRDGSLTFGASRIGALRPRPLARPSTAPTSARSRQ